MEGSISSRKLKHQFFNILKEENWIETIEEELEKLDSKLLPFLFSALYNKDDIVRWNAISCFGFLTKNTKD